MILILDITMLLVHKLPHSIRQQSVVVPRFSADVLVSLTKR
jgi:hypothetical protein